MESNQLLEIIYLLEDSYIGEYVRGSLWLFPVIQSFHLIGLGILGGAVVIGDFRLLGILMKTETTSYVIRVTKPWFNFGLSILILTGIPLFLSEAVKCYYSRAFWIKISCLLIGTIFVYFIRNPIVLSREEDFFIKTAPNLILAGDICFYRHPNFMKFFKIVSNIYDNIF